MSGKQSYKYDGQRQQYQESSGLPIHMTKRLLHMTKTGPAETEAKIPHPLFKVSFVFPRVLREAEAQTAGEALEELGVSVFVHNRDSADGDDWEISLTTYGEPDMGAIFAALEGWMEARGLEGLIAPENVTAEALPETDWLQHVYDNFPPVVTGRFFVHGSHYAGEKPEELIPLQIDAATAFGSGEHETTRGCLLAFEELEKRGKTFKNALDMGCGSGILAIAMTKIWPGIRVAAIDIDPESVTVTARHAAMNAAETDIEAAAGEGYATPLCGRRAPYDLIAANILAGPLIAMAPDLAKSLAPGGFCVLSGLLGRQEAEVAAAHEAEGLEPVHAVALGEWRALVFQKKG
ncbi:MAG: methyltransferase [Alphaproteobacteria bacterium]|nr:methyltransferase [Alphaproteobacteria bacterium]